MADLQFAIKVHLGSGMELLLYFRIQNLYTLRKKVLIGKKSGRK